MPYFFSASPHVGLPRAQKKQKLCHGERRFHEVWLILFVKQSSALWAKQDRFLCCVKGKRKVTYFIRAGPKSPPYQSSPVISLSIYPFSRFAGKSIDGIVKKKQDS